MHISADSKLSVNKAALLWGISTATIYKALDSGTLARSGDGKLVAAEMIRVFGRIKGENAVPAKPNTVTKPKSPRTPKPAISTPAPLSTAKPRRKKAAPSEMAVDAVSPHAAQVHAEPAIKPAPQAPQLAPTVRSIPPQLEQQLRLQIAQLEQQLLEAKAREDWLKAQINELWTEKVELQNAKKGVLGRLLG